MIEIHTKHNAVNITTRNLLNQLQNNSTAHLSTNHLVQDYDYQQSNPNAKILKYSSNIFKNSTLFKPEIHINNDLSSLPTKTILHLQVSKIKFPNRIHALVQLILNKKIKVSDTGNIQIGNQEIYTHLNSLTLSLFSRPSSNTLHKILDCNGISVEYSPNTFNENLRLSRAIILEQRQLSNYYTSARKKAITAKLLAKISNIYENSVSTSSTINMNNLTVTPTKEELQDVFTQLNKMKTLRAKLFYHQQSTQLRVTQNWFTPKVEGLVHLISQGTITRYCGAYELPSNWEQIHPGRLSKQDLDLAYDVANERLKISQFTNLTPSVNMHAPLFQSRTQLPHQ